MDVSQSLERKRSQNRIRQAERRKRLSAEQKAEIKLKDKLAHRLKRSGPMVTDHRRNRWMVHLHRLNLARQRSSRIPALRPLLDAYINIRSQDWIRALDRYQAAAAELRVTRSVTSRRRLMGVKESCRKLMVKWIKKTERNRKSGATLKRFDQDMNILGSLLQANPNTQLLKALSDAQHLATVGRKIVECGGAEMDRIIEVLRDQVTTGVYHPPDKRENDKVLRNVGRLRYHIVSGSDANTAALASFYPSLWREFMDMPEENSGLDAAVRDLVSDMVRKIVLNVEEEDDSGQEEQPQDSDDANVMSMRIAAELDEQDPMLAAMGGEHAARLTARVIKGRRCDVGCALLSKSEAVVIKKSICDLYDKRGCPEIVKRIDQLFDKVEPILRAKADCYSGLRSVRARMKELKAVRTAIGHAQRFLRGNSKTIEEAISREDWIWLPIKIRKEIEPLFGGKAEAAKHSEAEVRKKYGVLIGKFGKEMADLEMDVCSGCDRYVSRRECINRTSYQVDDQLRNGAKNGSTMLLCNKCTHDAYHSKVPSSPSIMSFSPKNNVDFQEVPACLKNLTWMEKNLIQKCRPIRAIACLLDKGGRPTTMRSTGGGMVILPVPVESTLDHVAETLPSDANLTIVISSAQLRSSKLVCLPRVIEALQWLKDHNPHYAQININNRFRFAEETIVIDETGANTTESERDDLVTDDPNHPTLLTYAGISEEIVKGNHAKKKSGTALHEYLLNKLPSDIISNQQPHLDELAFPWHFARGKDGFDRSRPREIEPHMFVRWALATTDRRIARDPQVLAFYHGILEQWQLRSIMATQVRMSRGVLESDAFDDLVKDADLDTECKFHTIGRSMRGHVLYWDEIKRKLKTHISIYGGPTWFFTLNPAEKDWEEALEIYRMVFGSQVNADNIFTFISKDPYFFSRYFQRRVRNMYSEMILQPDGPLGDVVHFMYRIEYQARGTQHIHCMLWDRNAPGDDASDEEKLDYISKYVTARMPNEQSEPELHGLVKKFQTHYQNHSPTCLRKSKINGRIVERCRFYFPRMATPVPIVNPVAESAQGLPGVNSKPYFLARKADETFINDYSPGVLLAWQSNVDVQFLWNGMSFAVDYTTSYASKSEKPKEGSRVQRAIKEATTSQAAMHAFSDMIRMKESGMIEVIDLLLGHSLYSFDSTHIVVNTNESDKRDRVLKGKDLQQPGRKKYMENVADDFYPNRSDELEQCSYIGSLMYFKVAKKPDTVKRPPPEQPNTLSIHYRTDSEFSPFYSFPHISRGTARTIDGLEYPKAHIKLAKPLVPRLFWPHFEKCNQSNREDYFRRLIMLIIPWRDEDRLKYDAVNDIDHETFEERWLAHTRWLAESGDQDMVNGLEDIKRLIRNHEALIEMDEKSRQKRKELRDMRVAEGIDDDDDGQLLVMTREVDAAAHDQDLKNMNDDQLKIFEAAVKIATEQDLWDRQKEAIEADTALTESQKRAQLDQMPRRPEAMRLIVLGNAGCGKSFVINSIADALTLKFCVKTGAHDPPPAIVLAAPTGLAATQIKGSTIHSVFGIEVQHGRDSAMRPLKPRKLNMIRVLMKNVRLIIIDELSMVSSITLAKINLRLQEILDCNDEFGGMNLMLLGDLMQLPPVLASPIFKPLTTEELRNVFNSVLPSYDLFSLFSYAELTQNMRQKGDTSFADLLKRMRVEQMTADDFKTLQTRVIPTSILSTDVDRMGEAADYYIKIRETDEFCMGLFGTNDEVNEFNEEVIDRLALESIVVEAIDSLVESERSANGAGAALTPKSRIYQQARFSLARNPQQSSGKRNIRHKSGGVAAHRAGGLEKSLLLATNGRIMLRRNTNATKGLVNGATGVLKEIIKSTGGEPIGLKIEFDGKLGTHVIEKATATFDVGKDEKIAREQFPVMMAFGATVHKTQGLTLSNAIISTNRFFSPGQAFVAFSRVKTLEGLHLVDCIPAKFYCSKPALKVYNSLRASINLPPFVSTDQPSTMPDSPLATSSAPSPVTPTTTAASRTSSSKRRRLSAPRISMIPPPSTTTPTSRNRVVAQASVTIGNQRCLALQNTMMDCFANAVTNLIDAMVPFRDAIVTYAQTDAACPGGLKALADLLSENTNWVKDMRTAYGMLRYGGGDCAAELLQLILNEIPPAADEMLYHDLFFESVCVNGHTSAVPRASSFYTQILSNALPAGMVEGTVESILREQALASNDVCNVCQAATVDMNVDFSMGQGARYFVVKVNRHTFDQASGTRSTRDLRFSETPAARVRIFGTDFRLLAGIEHKTGAGGLGGHYVLWKKAPRGWILIDDNKPPSQRTSLGEELKRFHIYVYEKQ